MREGLIIGTACSQGELFEAMMQKGMQAAEKVAEFYDFIEVQPKPVYAPLIERELVRDEKALEEILKNIVRVGEKLENLSLRLGMCITKIQLIKFTVKF